MNENMNLTCVHCGCTAENLTKVANGDYVCQDCLDSMYTSCDDCGEYILNEDARIVNREMWRERYVCPSCLEDYARCDDCGEYFSSGYIHTDNDGQAICSSCYSMNDWAYCRRCGRLVRQEDAVWDDDREEWFCEPCFAELPSRNFHNYGYKPNPDFKFRHAEETSCTNKKVAPLDSILTFGVELEIDCGDDHNDVSDALAALGMPIYMKHDGSLGEEGVEIVTHPCSLAFHQYDMRWAEICRISRQHNYLSHKAGTCGLHIHIGRRQMGNDWSERDRTANNMVLLVNRLWDEIVKFSRRTEGQLDDWAQRPDIDVDGCLTDDELQREARRVANHGRYQAVNLCNDSTVELRFFRGTLKRDTLIASIQLASNLTRYAMTHTPTECNNVTWADVVGFEQFKELKAYCEARGL